MASNSEQITAAILERSAINDSGVGKKCENLPNLRMATGTYIPCLNTKSHVRASTKDE